MNKIKFGVFLPFYAFNPGMKEITSTFDRVRNLVLKCEQLGYDSVWLDDHLMFKKQPILECWTTLSALSTITSTIRLGTLVVCNSFRNPALLSKMAATLDVISKGRFELGIGAGVQADEHEAYGISFPKLITRIDRMRESVEIIKKMWTEEKVSYNGKYYKMREAVCEPKPMQKPHPPIIIGGSGEKFTLKVTAQYADRYDWGYLSSLEIHKHKLEVLESYCKALGRDFQEIEKSCWLDGQIIIASDRKELDDRVLGLKQKGSLKELKKHNFIATPDKYRQKIRQYTSLGVTYFMLFFGDLPNIDSMELFARKVVKPIKTAD